LTPEIRQASRPRPPRFNLLAPPPPSLAAVPSARRHPCPRANRPSSALEQLRRGTPSCWIVCEQGLRLLPRRRAVLSSEAVITLVAFRAECGACYRHMVRKTCFAQRARAAAASCAALHISALRFHRPGLRRWLTREQAASRSHGERRAPCRIGDEPLPLCRVRYRACLAPCNAEMLLPRRGPDCVISLLAFGDSRCLRIESADVGMQKRAEFHPDRRALCVEFGV
jgi:hypothetical protein